MSGDRIKRYEASINIKPRIEGPKLIMEQDTTMMGQVAQMTAKVVDFENRTVREALFKMGWTPPCLFPEEESRLSKVTEERDRAVELLKMVAKNHKPLDELCDMAGVHRYTGMFSEIDDFLSSLTENKC